MPTILTPMRQDTRSATDKAMDNRRSLIRCGRDYPGQVRRAPNAVWCVLGEHLAPESRGRRQQPQPVGEDIVSTRSAAWAEVRACSNVPGNVPELLRRMLGRHGKSVNEWTEVACLA